MQKRNALILNLSQYLALAFVAAASIFELYPDGGPWWLVVILCVALGLVYEFWPYWWMPHLQLGVQVLLIAGIMRLFPFAFVLGFTLSVYAADLFPDKRAALWIAIMTISAVLVLGYWQDWVALVLQVLGFGLGYSAFGFFAYARTLAEAERRKSQRLLAELQQAHQQLKEYAAHIEELAIAEERNRLARELHDTLGHRLTVAAVQLEGAQRLISSDPERAAHMVGTVRQQVGEGLAELRRSVAMLRSPLESDLPLAVSLARLAKGFEEATGLPVHLEVEAETKDLPGPQRMAIYRAAQEGLTNVQRHAQARQVWLHLGVVDGKADLVVADDGVGLAGQMPGDRFGLRGLRERAHQLGGELRLSDRKGGGTQVCLSLPLQSPEASGEQVQAVAVRSCEESHA